MTIVVVAYNEGDRICRRIENLMELDYPRDRRTIVVASDGSTDDTVELARLYRERGVMVRAFGTRRGKAAVLNAIVPALRSDVVVFADARQRFERHTLRALVDNFSDPTIGAVGGELVISTGNGPAAAGRGAAFYWRYEKFIRSTEASADSDDRRQRRDLRHSSCAISTRSLMTPSWMMCSSRCASFVRDTEWYSSRERWRTTVRDANGEQEFVRKARTIAGTFQLFAREPWLLSPRRNRLWFETISHKGCV